MIENWLPNAIKKYRKILGAKNTAFRKQKEKEEKEMKEKIIGEYESSRIPKISGTNVNIDPNLLSASIQNIANIAAAENSKDCPTCGKEAKKEDPLSIGFYCPDCQKSFF